MQERLVLELLLIFIGLPLAFDQLLHRGYLRLLFPGMWALALWACVVLARDPTFDWRQLFVLPKLDANLAVVLLRNGLAVLTLALAARRLGYEPPRLRGTLRLLIFTLYPLLSVIPQGLIWRVFFVQRYLPLFGSGVTMLVVSALVRLRAHHLPQPDRRRSDDHRRRVLCAHLPVDRLDAARRLRTRRRWPRRVQLWVGQVLVSGGSEETAERVRRRADIRAARRSRPRATGVRLSGAPGCALRRYPRCAGTTLRHSRALRGAPVCALRGTPPRAARHSPAPCAGTTLGRSRPRAARHSRPRFG